MHSLCTKICSHPVLALPDLTKPFHSNTFNTAVSGVLMQQHASVRKPIALLSNTITSSE